MGKRSARMSCYVYVLDHHRLVTHSPVGRRATPLHHARDRKYQHVALADVRQDIGIGRWIRHDGEDPVHLHRLPPLHNGNVQVMRHNLSMSRKLSCAYCDQSRK
eukprot:2898452-Karenia_brevis.AAC.1